MRLSRFSAERRSRAKAIQISALAVLQLSLLGLAAACSEEPPPPVPVNETPSPRFSVPAWVQAGSDFVADASDSFDGDGTLLAFRWLPGDGRAELVSGSPLQTLSFAQPGSYLLRLQVEDNEGARASARHRVGVTLEAPARCVAPRDCGLLQRCNAEGVCLWEGAGESCANDTDCAGVGGVCHGGVCTAVDCVDDVDCNLGERCRVGLCVIAGASDGGPDGGPDAGQGDGGSGG